MKKKSQDYYVLTFLGVCSYIISIALIGLGVALFFYSDFDKWHLALLVGVAAGMGGKGCFKKAKQK